MMKKQIVFCALCFFSVFAVHKLTPQTLLADRYPVNLESLMPQNIPGWIQIETQQGESITSPELDEKLASIYSQIVTRRYMSSNGYQVMLSIAYTKDQRDNAGQQSHRPEICYPAQGFEIIRGSRSVSSRFHIPLVRFEAVNQDRYEVVTYFSTVGNKVANSNVDIKLAQLAYSIDGYVPDGMIFRVSSIDRNENVAFSIQEKFIDELLGAASEQASRILPIKH